MITADAILGREYLDDQQRSGGHDTFVTVALITDAKVRDAEALCRNLHPARQAE